ncbi:hypothetical protein [Mangrovimonas spongiae]|uniref:Uncharacterized protein n=1 Tax=Mangrovimonas spongiae TaxID=2494697 RepID=A0A428K4G7_9FLAO|nr:hypothetical protein [Mangrovimonas spongiae]RSK41299.1 hypothetical protein EJA19_00045 [Mangrovimonas spongiae]
MDSTKYDQILEFISRDENLNILCNKHLLQEKVFPDLHVDEIVELIDQMEIIKPKVFKTLNRGMTRPIQANGLTKKFLKQGGFSKIKHELLLEQQKALEKENLELEKTKVDLKLAKETLEEFPKTKKRAKVAYIVAILLAFLQLAEWIVSLMSSD